MEGTLSPFPLRRRARPAPPKLFLSLTHNAQSWPPFHLRVASTQDASTPAPAGATESTAAPTPASPPRPPVPDAPTPTPDDVSPPDAFTLLDEIKTALASGRAPALVGSLAIVDDGRRLRWMYIRGALPAGTTKYCSLDKKKRCIKYWVIN